MRVGTSRMAIVSIRAPARGATIACDGTHLYICVSIRAPARGATVARKKKRHLQQVSIRAPARGATPRGYVFLAFNPFQSARPRGARRALPGNGDTVYAFQSARPRGARLGQLGAAVVPARFQSARPRGARLCRFRSQRDSASFNPRAREGRDRLGGLTFLPPPVSIRAPARGATRPALE